MALFRRKAAVLRRGVGDAPTEELSTRKVGIRTVQVRRVQEDVAPPKKQKTPRPSRRERNRSGPAPRPGRQTFSDAGVAPPPTGRKQMLVRVRPHQTQAVVLEGPRLVEHYVHLSDQRSLVGNIYLGQVRSVLPGLEAAFVDIGADKNGILYAADVIATKRAPKNSSRIENLLKTGENIIVQVDKDAMGNKGPRLTSQVALPGRHLVLMPNEDAVGISRRLPDRERVRLRNIVESERPKGYGAIVRTAAEKASREEIRSDISRLVGQWRDIRNRSQNGKAPRALQEEPDLLLRVIREHFTPDFRRLLTDDRAAYRQMKSYLEDFAPQMTSKVHLTEEEGQGLFERFRVDDQLRRALERKVWLPSGGHLIIDRTEALTVIDVNTGKFVGTSNLEDTVLQNNLEAAEEVGRQLRLRDIGGIIVIDFIDMERKRNREAVLRRLRETLALDKTTTQVHEVSTLGLVEMTRKNVSGGLLEVFSDPCPKCEGRGILLHETAATSAAPIPPVRSDNGSRRRR